MTALRRSRLPTIELGGAGPSQAALLQSLILRAAQRAHEVLGLPSGSGFVREIEDDGLSRLEKLQLSPLVDDQLLALAIRRSAQLDGKDSETDLHDLFAAGQSTFAVEAQRRSVLSALSGTGLPTQEAAKAVETIVRREGLLAGSETAAVLRAHADLYADLWCDPRLGAPIPVRQVMLAMVNSFYDLSPGAGGTRGN